MTNNVRCWPISVEVELPGFVCKRVESVVKLDCFLLQGVGAIGFSQHLCRPIRESGHRQPTRRLGRASCRRSRGTAEKFGKPPQILSSCSEQHLVSGAAQAPQP
jgi:hypothetical protein